MVVLMPLALCDMAAAYNTTTGVVERGLRHGPTMDTEHPVRGTRAYTSSNRSASYRGAPWPRCGQSAAPSAWKPTASCTVTRQRNAAAERFDPHRYSFPSTAAQ